MSHIFVVEDDQGIRERLTRELSKRGHVVRAQSTAAAALTDIVESPPDVVVLDLGLPDIDGADLLRMLRGLSDVPVVVASARDDDTEIVRLLDAGADDYVVKPYSAEQLEARIRAVLRRLGPTASDRTQIVGDLVIDSAARQATLAGDVLDLTPKEFDLLAFLASRLGEVVSKEEIMGEVWRQPFGGAMKTVDVHLSWLRRKLGETASEPRFLHTVHRVGVQLVVPD